VNPIDAYARAVVAGHVPAGTYHRKACERHFRDRAREGTPAFPYRFDADTAARFVAFVALLKHYKGEWAGRPIVLEPWQVFLLGSLFGWIHIRTGFRRFRSVYCEIPRKNGKSTLAATAALYLTFFDREPGAEGYTIATKRDQAKIVFHDAQAMVRSSGLKDRIRVRVANLHQASTLSKLEPLGADHDSTDGLNPHVVVMDEWHAYKDRGLIDVMETATGARRQPVMFGITTAGSDPVSPCGDQHAYACQVLDQVLEDESFLAFIAHAEVTDDPWDPATWRKANPNFGVSVLPADLEALAHKARHMPNAANAFRQKRLNLWVQADAAWLSLDGWRAGQSTWTLADLAGQPCWIGIDLSSKIDLTAVVLLFPPTADRVTWRVVPWCLTPADTLDERAHRDRAPYRQWVEAGVLRTNQGARIDQDRVLELVAEAAGQFEVQQIGVDPYNAGNLVKELEGAGHVVVEVPQTIAQMTGPSKEFEADVLEGKVDAGGDPLMQWAIANTVVFRDNKDNIYPIKKRSRGRIDPVIATLIARKLAALPVPPAPNYEMFFLGGSPDV
jgi:phage terminase large subunit-like protein